MAEALRTLDKYEDAIFRYKTALNDEPRKHQCAQTLSWTYYKIGYYTATLNVAKKLKKTSTTEDFQHSICSRRLF